MAYNTSQGTFVAAELSASARVYSATELVTDGELGVGTTSPAASAHIYKAATTSAQTVEMMRLEVNDEGVDMNIGSGPGIDFYVGETGGSNYGGTLAVVREVAGDANSDAAMVFHTATDDQTPETDREKMRITSTGKVGIGVKDPDSALEVAGNVHLSSETTTPSTPAAADGGVMYTKADGELYWLSDDVAEIAISATPIAFNGSTSNGVLTYGGATQADVEANLTFDGSTLTVTGDSSLDGSVTINDAGAAKNFTVETADEDKMLFVDGANNRIAIGDNTGTPGATLEVKNNASAGAFDVPLVQLNSNDTNQVALDINAANIDVNVVDIKADAVTTAAVINIAADGLSTGNAFRADDNSADTGTRNTALIIQNNAAAIAATALTVQSDGGVTGVKLDKNYSDTTAATVTGLQIDFDKTGTSTSNNTMYGINIDMDNATATDGTNAMYGIYCTPTLTHAADAGTASVFGALVTATGGTNGAGAATGAKFTATGGDTALNTGVIIACDDGGIDLRIESSADQTDHFSIQTTAAGATTFTTVDSSATAAHLTFTVDGDITLDPAGGDVIVDGNVSGSGTLQAVGATTLGSTLSVSGTCTFDTITVAGTSGGEGAIFEQGLTIKNADASAGFINFYEQSSNGTNVCTFRGKSSMGNCTITLPGDTGTVVLEDNTVTLSNKTLSAPTLTGDTIAGPIATTGFLSGSTDFHSANNITCEGFFEATGAIGGSQINIGATNVISSGRLINNVLGATIGGPITTTGLLSGSTDFHSANNITAEGFIEATGSVGAAGFNIGATNVISAGRLIQNVLGASVGGPVTATGAISGSSTLEIVGDVILGGNLSVSGSLTRPGGSFFPPKFADGVNITWSNVTTISLGLGDVRDSFDAGNIILTASVDVALTRSGVNGLDTGTEATSTWYTVWAITGPGVSVGGLLSTDTVNPTMPSGYTLKRRVGWIYNHSDGDVQNFLQAGSGRTRHYLWQEAGADYTKILTNGTNVGSWATVDCSSLVPSTAYSMKGRAISQLAVANANNSCYPTDAEALGVSWMNLNNNASDGTTGGYGASYMQAQEWPCIVAKSFKYRTYHSTNRMDVSIFGWTEDI